MGVPLTVVPARVSSRRLPGKVLAEVSGRPLLACTLERLQRCRTLADIVVATSWAAEDDRIEALARKLSVPVHRGPLDDVLGRLVGAARARQAGAVVRISGDSPLIDPGLVDRVVGRFLVDPCDVVTNVFPRSFPAGQSVEVVATAALEEAAAATSDPGDREHVTRYFYRHPGAYTIRNVASDRDLSRVQLAVDTADDLALTTRIFAAMDQPHWEYGLDEILAIRERVLHSAATMAGTG
jgi:spore coat polysaccharide biosynthesis protein SpsF